MKQPQTRFLLVLVGLLVLLALLLPGGGDQESPPAAPSTGEDRPNRPKAEVIRDGGDPASTRILGRVVHPDGTPARGARVVLFAEDYWYDFALRSVAAGPSGRFAFFAGRSDWSYIPLRVRAELGDLLTPTASAGSVREGGGLDLGDLVLEPSFRPVILVETDHGKSFPGAEVELTVPPAEKGGEWTRHSVETDAAGQARFPAMVHCGERKLDIEVTHAECVSVSKEVTTAELASAPYRIVLVEGLPVTGRVVRPEGTPVAGARVVLLPTYHRLRLPGTAPDDAGMNCSASGESGIDGRFSFPVSVAQDLCYVPPITNLAVRAEADGLASYWRPAVLGGKQGEVGDLVLLPAAEPEVIVLSEEDRPVVGVAVELRFYLPGRRPRVDTEQYHTLAARSDADGRARFPPAVRDGKWVVNVLAEHPGYSKLDRSVPIADILAGPVEVRLSSGRKVTGRVLLPDGSPAVAYEVNIDGRRDDRSIGRVRQDGAFEVPGVPSRRCLLEIRESALEIAVHVAVPKGAPGVPVDLGTIRMPALGAIRGRIVDDDGRPIQHVYVNASLGMRGNRSKGSDENGRFVIDRLPPGKYDVRASLDPEDGCRLAASVRKVEPGGDDVTILLSKAGTVLFVFHARERPEEPLSVASIEIRMDGMKSWSWSGYHRSRRIRPPVGIHEFVVKVRSFTYAVISGVEVFPDREQVVDLCLERTE